jgi:short-subunit dehydrogenase involved in D-alanine esterification of teichoic acids
VRDPAHFAVAQQTIDINLLGTIRVIDAFTPHLTGRGAGTIITVSSGTGFLPFPPMPTYGASKAGVHAYSEALRAQLDGTGVEVCELVPRPWPTPRRWQGSTPTRWGWPSSAPR